MQIKLSIYLSIYLYNVCILYYTHLQHAQMCNNAMEMSLSDLFPAAQPFNGGKRSKKNKNSL